MWDYLLTGAVGVGVAMIACQGRLRATPPTLPATENAMTVVLGHLLTFVPLDRIVTTVDSDRCHQQLHRNRRRRRHPLHQRLSPLR